MVKGTALVAAPAAADDDEQVSVLIPQAPGKEVTALAAVATLGDALPQARAPVAVVLVVTIAKRLDPFPQATAPVPIVIAEMLQQGITKILAALLREAA